MKNLYLNKKDIIVYFVIIPLILILFYILPSHIKQLFVLDRSNPNPFSLYFSSFVHLDFNHFISNLLTYFLLIFSILYLETNKKILYTFTALTFLFVPFITSFLFLTVVPKELKTSIGFSNIVSAFNGYLLFAVFSFLKKLVKSLSIYFYSFMIFLSFFVLFVLNPLFFSWLIVIIPVLILLFILVFKEIEKVFKTIKKSFFRIKKEKSILKLISKVSLWILIFVLTIFSLPILIPTEIISNGYIINTLAHYAGYVFGLITPLAISAINKNK